VVKFCGTCSGVDLDDGEEVREGGYIRREQDVQVHSQNGIKWHLQCHKSKRCGGFHGRQSSKHNHTSDFQATIRGSCKFVTYYKVEHRLWVTARVPSVGCISHRGDL